MQHYKGNHCIFLHLALQLVVNHCCPQADNGLLAVRSISHYFQYVNISGKFGQSYYFYPSSLCRYEARTHTPLKLG